MQSVRRTSSKRHRNIVVIERKKRARDHRMQRDWKYYSASVGIDVEDARDWFIGDISNNKEHEI